MTLPLVRFMSAPRSDSTVRYDLNNRFEGRRVLDDGFSLGTPTLEGDPDALGVLYRPRRLVIPVRIEGTKQEAFAAQSAIARELLRQSNWLQVQVGAFPVWFSTYRTEPGELLLEFVDADSDSSVDYWRLTVQLDAEPFAYGERVTLPAITIANDPAAVSNPCMAVLPAIVGDAPAPVRIQVAPDADDAMNGFRWMHSIASFEAGTSWSEPIVWDIGTGDGFTPGADTGSPVSNSAYSGGTYRAVSFATNATLIDRISGAVPAALPPGRYKALVRVARSDTSSKFSFRLGQLVGGVFHFGDTVAMDRDASSGAGHATWVDLGEFQHPRGNQAPADVAGDDYAPTIALKVGRTSGSGSCYLDVIMLIPIETAETIETRTLFSDFTALGVPDGGSGTWDGDLQAFWAIDSTGIACPALPVPQGAYPQVIPGAVNVLHMLQQVGGGKPSGSEDSPDDIGSSTVVTISYHPRYLWLGES